SPETSIASDTSPSTSSSAVAPGSSYVSPTSSSIGLSPFNVISGATVSSCPSPFTSTSTRTLSLFAVHFFSLSPDTVHTTSYAPTVELSTSPVTSIASDTSPSTSSSAVAPGSSYVSPTSSSIGLSPFNVISGATVSSGSGSSTVTVARTLSPFGVQVAGMSP